MGVKCLLGAVKPVIFFQLFILSIKRSPEDECIAPVLGSNEAPVLLWLSPVTLLSCCIIKSIIPINAGNACYSSVSY